jgi:serine/threonine-protein kinase RsbW
MPEPASADPSSERSEDADQVEVSVPLRTEYVATLRTVAASLGADAGFSIDEIDDLRLAISEVVSSLIDSKVSGDDRIVASFDLRDAGVAVGITTRRGELQIELDDLASSILQSVVDEYEVSGAHVRLLKLASEAVGVTEADDERVAHGA